jgi:hypothetical protein
MDLSVLVMWTGFALASYSVVGNDVIQTLGTFLTSNEQRVPWYILWLFAATILGGVLVYGYANADIAYGRLDKFTFPDTFAWYYLLPPIVLLLITRWGIPVSTTFMILTLFSLNNIPGDFNSMFASLFDTQAKLGGMINKSILGYLIAFGAAMVIYLAISRPAEKYFIEHPLQQNHLKYWVAAQWLSTGFLWTQWLVQDLANIYIYLKGGAQLSTLSFGLSLLLILGLLGFIFYTRGGKVQNVVREKTNTTDIRSATFIDLIYGLILFVFMDDYLGLWGGKLPMSTTWVFVGLLAGREIAMRIHLEKKVSAAVLKMVARDAGKISLGLVVSVILVFAIKLMAE